MNCQKHLFSLDPTIHYLNCAYKAPMMKSAEEAALQAIQRERNPSQISIQDFFHLPQMVKENFAKIIHAKAEQIALIPSVTYGFSSALNNITAKTNGKAIIVKEAFPSGYYTLERWCKENNNVLETIDPDIQAEHFGQAWNEKILASITEDTSLVLVPTVHWMTGLKYDLKSIGAKCKKLNAKLVVDGTQSVGALPLNVKACHISALICATYKWLLGPYSMGFLYMTEDFNQGTPLEESWMNRTNAADFRSLTEYTPDYNPGAARYNVGETSNFILLPILQAALEQINTWSVAGIQSYCENLTEKLKQYLSSIDIRLEEDAYLAHHLFSIPFGARIDEIKLDAALKKENIILSVRGDNLRISTNVFNDENDIHALIKALEKSKR